MNNEDKREELMITDNDFKNIFNCLQTQVEINTQTQVKIQKLAEESTQTQDKIQELAERIREHSGDIDKLKNEAGITKAQANRLQRFGATRIHELLGASDSTDYVVYSRTFFGHLWHDFKKRFGVSYYGDIRRVDYDESFNFIEAWYPDEGLEGLKALVDRRDDIRKAILAG